MPNRVKDDEMAARIEELRRRADELGRPPIPVTVVGMMRDPQRIERLEQAGVHRGVFWLPPDGREEVERAFDKYVAAVREYQGAPA
jgi:hypothetical protein